LTPLTNVCGCGSGGVPEARFLPVPERIFAPKRRVDFDRTVGVFDRAVGVFDRAVGDFDRTVGDFDRLLHHHLDDVSLSGVIDRLLLSFHLDVVALSAVARLSCSLSHCSISSRSE
jgi:hypothetical protein